jgi:hypothetical protein
VAVADASWAELGVRPEAVARWESAGADAFTAALAQSDGYGPDSARHELGRLRAVAGTWRGAGLGDAQGLEWHRAGFVAREAKRWIARGVSLAEAAVAAGKGQRG